MKLQSLSTLLLLASCGEPICSACRSDDMCNNGEVCLLEGPNAGTCARTCNLTVWHEGDDWDAPCAAGVDTCPETCMNQEGVYGHCTAHPSLTDDVGICRAPAGELVCPL